ncbi:hypothetical protein F2Q68_00015090 [Brassica cretica]|uniref:Uncharacterized protein n=1 Tax=Brassica cretica TaxID=69181 RepID=A0A8S9HQC4_BRACR|nr:hypothetical protein F2Q68_00015090 [Brassica cretica]KAF3583297.1 hypothetical protein F2Q69_00028831 [Brassica cretica]
MRLSSARSGSRIGSSSSSWYITHLPLLEANSTVGIQRDATMVEPDDYATKDKPGWMNGKIEDEPLVAMEHNELIFAVKIMSNKLEKM